LTIANYVTLLRIAFIPLLIILLFLGFNGLAAILFLLLSFSDAVDGYIARRFKQVSEIGKFLDPLADKILVMTVLIALVGMGRADSIPVMIIAAREFLVSGIRISAAKSRKIMAASPMAKIKTIAQLAAVAMLLLSLPYADWVLWLAVFLSIISGGAYLWQSRILKQLKLS
jgi:CDP-diacylglycerol--glycerol-3-phosphate 3-phosphatidyltransferase